MQSEKIKEGSQGAVYKVWKPKVGRVTFKKFLQYNNYPPDKKNRLHELESKYEAKISELIRTAPEVSENIKKKFVVVYRSEAKKSYNEAVFMPLYKSDLETFKFENTSLQEVLKTAEDLKTALDTVHKELGLTYTDLKLRNVLCNRRNVCTEDKDDPQEMEKLQECVVADLGGFCF